ncbi:MAG: SOS response-associated peptidase [Xanthobacteraceae bacterium]
MCGRYKLTVPFSEIVRLYNLTNNVNLALRYNIAPTQDIAVVRYDLEKGRTLAMLHWGLIPPWSNDLKSVYGMINAKAETVAEKPAYRSAFKSRRCLVLADGFYEWKGTRGEKQPYLIRMTDGGVFAFAGLWERWSDRKSGATIESASIITTEPNAVCAPIHIRMPVILKPEDYPRWLGEKAADPADLLALLKPYPPEPMEAIKIGTRINNVKYDEPSLIEPI